MKKRILSLSFLIVPLLIGVLGAVLLCTPHAMAQDVLVGRVVSVDRDAGEFVMAIGKSDEEIPEKIIVKKAASKTKEYDHDRTALFLPECVQPGNIVRIWGEKSINDSTVFHANFVRGSGLGRHDTSGIRARINRLGRQFGRQNHRLHQKRH